MSRKPTIILFYTGIAAVCIGIVALSNWLRSGVDNSYQPQVVDTGKETAPQWFEIGRDLSAVNQENQPVKLSDLRGKVWVVAEFFAVCPHCAVRNGEELRKIYDEFKSHPDFHVTCISVDPETDTPEKLGDYSKALGADAKNWWFLNAGKAADTHEYLEKELKFFGIRERSNPLEIEAEGRYAHDLGFLLVDREFRVIGKWPLADARSEEAKKRDPGLYDRLRNEMFSRIRAELEKKRNTRNLMNGELKRWLALPPNEALSKKLGVAAWILSAVVLLLVVAMQKIKLPLPDGWSTTFLPPFHAAVNAAAAVVLMVALAFIKMGKVGLHRAAMIFAMLLSVLFLLSYVAYHMTNDPTRYGGEGTLRTVYFVLLVSHIVLAAVSLPFILFTFIAAWTNRFAAHRRLARWVFPMWLYVAVTGPICYWMLRPYYG